MNPDLTRKVGVCCFWPLFMTPPKPSSQKFLLPFLKRVHILGHMDTNEIIDAFTALSQITRLDAFRLLVRHEPEGLPAGELARLLEVPHNTMSAHLGILSRSGLITSKRQGRSIIYRASLARMNDVLGFMVNDCCAGHPELCPPLQRPGRAKASCEKDEKDPVK